jgi:hypothetical protein
VRDFPREDTEPLEVEAADRNGVKSSGSDEEYLNVP